MTMATATPSATSDLYGETFYDSIRGSARASAEVIVPIVVEAFQPSSVIDVGCGTGTWLTVFRQRGVGDVLGIDGSWVRPAAFEVGADHFANVDLAQPYVAPRRFDLAISLEVAEHLPPSSAWTFVQSLASCSDLILFSAACPGQDGTNHVNEQWPDYWVQLFERAGYTAVDWLRPRIWRSQEVAWWYAQNALVFVRRHSAIAGHPLLAAATSGYERLAHVHPAHYGVLRQQLAAARQRGDLRQRSILHLLRAAAGNTLRRLTGARVPHDGPAGH